MNKVLQEKLEQSLGHPVHISKSMKERLSLDEWQKSGEPVDLILCEQDGNIHYYEDVAYGHVILVNEESSDFSIGKDIAILNDYTGLSEYFGESATGLYHKIN